MNRSRYLQFGVVVLVVVSMVSGCSRGPSEEELKKAALDRQLATMEQQYQDLQQARADLAEAKSTLVEIEAMSERERSGEQSAMVEELPARIEELSATRDQAFEALQATLADFLNVALNEFPQDPATVKGLNIYSDEAILIAEEIVVKAGDYKKAIQQMDSAASYYDSLEIPVYLPLEEKIAEFQEMRYINQERFDQVAKNMTKEEVKETVGPPYYQNIQIDEKRGVETWLYRKREGGAAAIYFKTRTGKVYDKSFEAIKTQVVED